MAELDFLNGSSSVEIMGRLLMSVFIKPEERVTVIFHSATPPDNKPLEMSVEEFKLFTRFHGKGQHWRHGRAFMRSIGALGRQTLYELMGGEARDKIKAMSELGKLGQAALKRNHTPEALDEFRRRTGRQGGLVTAARHGREHFRRANLKGNAVQAETRRQKELARDGVERPRFGIPK